MAGGKITRIVGGTNRIECKKWTVYTDEFNAYAGGKSSFTADGGTNFGKPEEPELKKGYFVKGWWGSDLEGNQKIREAFVGEKVYFHLETRNIPNGKYIGATLYDSDTKYIIENDNIKGNDKIKLRLQNSKYKYLNYFKVSNNKVIIKINLEGIIENMINEEADNIIELFFVCSYEGQNIELPIAFGDYLKVKREINYGGLFLFIITDEFLPSGKIVRKVIVPPPKNIFDYFKSNIFELYGMSPPKPLVDISIGQHASGFNQSPYLSGSTLPYGAPNIKGSAQYIDY